MVLIWGSRCQRSWQTQTWMAQGRKTFAASLLCVFKSLKQLLPTQPCQQCSCCQLCHPPIILMLTEEHRFLSFCLCFMDCFKKPKTLRMAKKAAVSRGNIDNDGKDSCRQDSSAASWNDEDTGTSWTGRMWAVFFPNLSNRKLSNSLVTISFHYQLSVIVFGMYYSKGHCIQITSTI